jgi:hypothetical protein
MRDLRRVPAHVRNFHAGQSGETHHFARQDPESSHAGIFLAAFKEHLVTHADAEKRTVRRDPFAHRLHEAASRQGRHAISKRPLPGKHQRSHPRQIPRLLHQHRFAAQSANRVAHALQIPAAVVDDAGHVGVISHQ